MMLSPGSSAPQTLTRAQVTQIRALQDRRERYTKGLFLVEGRKNILELIRVRPAWLTAAYVSEAFYGQLPGLLPQMSRLGDRVTPVGLGTLERLTTLERNQDGVAVARLPTLVEVPQSKSGSPVPAWTLALEGIRDPGNVGTLIRTADWFGWDRVVLSADCADPYSPKTIMATMGSFTRIIPTMVTDLPAWLTSSGQPVYGAILDGEPMTFWHGVARPAGVLVIGSESHGLSPGARGALTHSLMIPGAGPGRAESLNAAIAGSMLMYALSTGYPQDRGQRPMTGHG